ncbi:SusC/RagA family TonB-linked outer membrane protein [Flavicella sediminum]|uniref:SusC/RagA family TonB-linked outer membrane protein n=1 Tax=Flavicella sediminum TaxID=2585141 RepID=UPI0011209CB0|nr:TonB-dependent receptor [Flavicella sediminum]
MNLKNVLKIKKSTRKLYFLCSCFLLCFVLQGQAQKITVSGLVTSSDDGLPIPGLSVLVLETGKGVVTDFDGLYTIKTDIGHNLSFSYVGMEKKIIKVTKPTLNIKMTSLLESLEEVVVIGYGAIAKKEVTGAVAQIKAEEIEEFITSDLGTALQGQIAGVTVTSSSGEPGSEANIEIRGITSLAGSNNPLYVVDGIPQLGNPGMSPNEIETIDVLKDAGSTAVYGARGAAGVILITTKRGKAGTAKVTFTNTYGIQNLKQGLPLMNAKDQLYFNSVQEFYFDGKIRDINQESWLNNDNSFTDYVVVDNAATKKYDLNITGGTKGFTYNAVVGYFDQDGIIINSNYQRFNSRLSTTYKSDNWKIDVSAAVATDKKVSSSSSLFQNTAFYSPIYPEIDPNSDVAYTNGSGTVSTPLERLLGSIRTSAPRNKDSMNSSVSVSRNFGENFILTTRFGGSVTNEIRNTFKPNTTIIDISDNSVDIDPTRSSVSAEAIRSAKYSFDGILNYKKQLGEHALNITTSFSAEKGSKESFLGSKEGVANNNIMVLNGATINPRVTSGNNYTKTTVGSMGRIQYNYQRKYLFSVLARYDGSSRFGEKHRWGLFPTISAGWNVSDEDFWTPLKHVVNNLRLRASQGMVGNDSFSDYEFASTLVQSTDYIFDPTDQSQSFGSIVKSYSNKDVKWETSVSTNIGLDVGFFKNKLTLTADVYRTKKRDMLFPVRLPGSLGGYYDSLLTLNVGNMENQGIELSARYKKRVGNSNFTLGVNFGKNENVVTKMAGETTIIFNSGSNLGGVPVTVLEVGREVGAFYLYKTNGIIKTEEQLEAYKLHPSRSTATLGDLIYVDTNGDGDISDLDRQYSGSGLQDFDMGLNFGWKYKNWDLAMNWYASVGAEIINGQKREAYSRGRHKDLVNMWTPENPNSNTPFYKGRTSVENFAAETDKWLESGDYLRLKLITIGYSLPKKVCEDIGLQSLRLFGTSQNPLTFTKYEGFEPEIGGNVQKRGLDLDRYPTSILYSFGLKVVF